MEEEADIRILRQRQFHLARNHHFVSASAIGGVVNAEFDGGEAPNKDIFNVVAHRRNVVTVIV